MCRTQYELFYLRFALEKAAISGNVIKLRKSKIVTGIK